MGGPLRFIVLFAKTFDVGYVSKQFVVKAHIYICLCDCDMCKDGDQAINNNSINLRYISNFFFHIRKTCFMILCFTLIYTSVLDIAY